MYSNTAEQDTRERVQALAEKLYRERRQYLLRIAARNAANEADAEEAVQFAFLAFIEHFDPDGGAPPLAWVTLVAKRRCWALHRSQRLDRSAGQEAERGGEGPGAIIDAIPLRAGDPAQLVERVDEARAKLATLKPQELRALTLLAAGFSYKEIAAMNRWTYTKVNRCIAEGRARMRANAATDQPQTRSRGGETERASALASRPAKKEEPVDRFGLDRLNPREVVR